jgi:hypothetical protein
VETLGRCPTPHAARTYLSATRKELSLRLGADEATKDDYLVQAHEPSNLSGDRAIGRSSLQAGMSKFIA